MSPEEILKKLEINRGSFPEEDMQTAFTMSKQLIPEFISILQKLTNELKANNKAELPDFYTLHIYALFYLAQFKANEAYPVIIDFLSCESEQIYKLIEVDVRATQDLDRILASVATEDLEPLISMIKNRTLDGYIRGSALCSLLCLYNWNRLGREKLLSIISDLYNTLEKKTNFIWNELITCSVDIHATECIDAVKEAYRNNLLVSSRAEPLEKVLESFKLSQEEALKIFRSEERIKPIDNFISELKEWSWFNPIEYTIHQDDTLLGNMVRTRTKISRNSLCPCGSGKKYKKCCGA